MNEVTREVKSVLRTKTVTPKVIRYVRDRIVEAIHPRQIILFGSQAEGGKRGGGDLDLLVVHDTARSDREVRRQLDRLFLGRRFGLDLIVRKPEEVAANLADQNPFYTEHIFRRGRVLYERGAARRGQDRG